MYICGNLPPFSGVQTETTGVRDGCFRPGAGHCLILGHQAPARPRWLAGSRGGRLLCRIAPNSLSVVERRTHVRPPASVRSVPGLCADGRDPLRHCFARQASRFSVAARANLACRNLACSVGLVDSREFGLDVGGGRCFRHPAHALTAFIRPPHPQPRGFCPSFTPARYPPTLSQVAASDFDRRSALCANRNANLLRWIYNSRLDPVRRSHLCLGVVVDSRREFPSFLSNAKCARSAPCNHLHAGRAPSLSPRGRGIRPRFFSPARCACPATRRRVREALYRRNRERLATACR